MGLTTAAVGLCGSVAVLDTGRVAALPLGGALAALAAITLVGAAGVAVGFARLAGCLQLLVLDGGTARRHLHSHLIVGIADLTHSLQDESKRKHTPCQRHLVNATNIQDQTLLHC